MSIETQKLMNRLIVVLDKIQEIEAKKEEIEVEIDELLFERDYIKEKLRTEKKGIGFRKEETNAK